MFGGLRQKKYSRPLAGRVYLSFSHLFSVASQACVSVVCWLLFVLFLSLLCIFWIPQLCPSQGSPSLFFWLTSAYSHQREILAKDPKANPCLLQKWSGKGVLSHGKCWDNALLSSISSKLKIQNLLSSDWKLFQKYLCIH